CPLSQPGPKPAAVTNTAPGRGAVNEKRPSWSASAQTFGGALSLGGHGRRYTLAPPTGLPSGASTPPPFLKALSFACAAASAAGARFSFVPSPGAFAGAGGALLSCPAPNETTETPSAPANKPAQRSVEASIFVLVSTMCLETSCASVRIL